MVRRRKARGAASDDPTDPAVSSSTDRQPSPAETSSSETPDVTADTPAGPPQKCVDPTVVAATKARTKKRSLGFMFIIGGIVGLLLAGLARNQDMVNLELLQELNLDTLVDAMPSIPAGILKEANDISQREKHAISHDAFGVGMILKQRGLAVNHPVVMVPGVISTGLESWGTEGVTRPYFRKRMWGSWSMLRAMVTDKQNWKQHVMLDKETGLDPEGFKLRAAQGFDATDFFVTGYWIWSKILENLAAIGYDPSSAYTAAYDWRLAYQNLEVRDHYFSRLKAYIETSHKIQGKKVVLVAHSMGSQVVHYFFKWVEAEGYGNGGSRWVETHIDSFINISGCMLGAVKGLPAVLSGEMKDTAQLNQFAVYGLERFFSREDRAEIMRAMPGISSMLPKGGSAVWGNLTWAPDDTPTSSISYGNFMRFTQANSTLPSNLTLDQSLDYLLDTSEEWYTRMVRQSYSHGIAHTKKQVELNERRPETWVNPLESRLPYAPNLKIYCFYGIGKPTERSYYFRDLQPDPNVKTKVVIDTSVSSDTDDTDRGVVLAEGDGTVPLVSAGYMCAKGWKMKRYNPAGAKVKIVEMPDEPGRFDIRGGPNTGDHVDILGRRQLNELLLRVAAGEGDLIPEMIESDIVRISERVEIWDD